MNTADPNSVITAVRMYVCMYVCMYVSLFNEIMVSYCLMKLFINLGFVGEENVKYVMPPEKLNEDNSKDDAGNVLVQWLMQGDSSNIRQYNVTWKNLLDGTVQHRCLDPDIGKCTIPVTRRKLVAFEKCTLYWE